MRTLIQNPPVSVPRPSRADLVPLKSPIGSSAAGGVSVTALTMRLIPLERPDGATEDPVGPHQQHEQQERQRHHVGERRAPVDSRELHGESEQHPAEDRAPYLRYPADRR